jgi:hypothetical protein
MPGPPSEPGRERSVEVIALHFRPTEDLHGYATLLHQVFTTVGLPVALRRRRQYFWCALIATGRSPNNWRAPRPPPIWAASCTSSGSAMSQARSPQGKGRVERLWGTLQDRLVSGHFHVAVPTTFLLTSDRTVRKLPGVRRIAA